MSPRKKGTEQAGAGEDGGSRAWESGCPCTSRENAKRALEAINPGDRETVKRPPRVYSAKGHIQFEPRTVCGRGVKTYSKLLELQPRQPNRLFQPWYLLLKKTGRWQDATDAFLKSLETDPKRVDAQLGLGICLLHQDKPEPALEHFEKVLSAKPDHESASFGKAVSLQLLWKVRRIVGDLQEDSREEPAVR